MLRLVALTLVFGCASPSPHEVLWSARHEERSHRVDCGAVPVGGFLPAPSYVITGDYSSPDTADALVPSMGDYHECLARSASRRRNCVVQSCNPDEWDECPADVCDEPSEADMSVWNCALTSCGFGGDPRSCLE